MEGDPVIEPSDPPAVSTARRWAGRGAWALLDQTMFAGSNFLVSIVLARWLTEAEYGWFAVAYAVFLLLGVFHTSVLTEPMLVFASGRYRTRRPWYLGTVLIGHFALVIPLGLLLAGAGVVAWVGGEPLLGGALMTLGVTQATQYLPWLLRDVCYACYGPRPSALSGMLYLATMLLGLWGLNHFGWLGVSSALLVMGAAAGVASLSLIVILPIGLRAAWRRRRTPEILRAHWGYGRWATLTNVTHFVPQHLPILVLPLFLSEEASGALKALLNFATPFVLMAWATSPLLIPTLVQKRGTPVFRRAAWVAIAVLVPVPILAWVPIWGWHDELFALLYGGNYAGYASLLWIVGLIPVLAIAHCLIGARLRAAERPDLVLVGSVASSVTLVAVGLPLLLWVGFSGVLVAIVAAHAANLVADLIAGRHAVRAASTPADATDRDATDRDATDRDAADRDAAPDAAIPLPPLPAEPLVTVIMANYNYERYVGLAVRSVIEQTYRNWELLVCDDGSTDGSVAAIRAAAGGDPRVRVFEKVNGGQASAWNAVWPHATGTVVCLLDSDDIYEHDKLARVVQAFVARPNTGLLVHRLQVITGTGEPVQVIPFMTRMEYGWIADRVVARGGRWRFLPTSGLCVRREVAEPLFPLDVRRFGPWAESLLFTAGPLLTPVTSIDAPLAQYRVHQRQHSGTSHYTPGTVLRDLRSVWQPVHGANERLEAMGRGRPLDIRRHLQLRTQAYVLARLWGRPGGWRGYFGLMRDVVDDDLYSGRQKALAAVVYGMLLILPRRARGGWLHETLGVSRVKRWFQGGTVRRQRNRPDATTADGRVAPTPS